GSLVRTQRPSPVTRFSIATILDVVNTYYTTDPRRHGRCRPNQRTDGRARRLGAGCCHWRPVASPKNLSETCCVASRKNLSETCFVASCKKRSQIAVCGRLQPRLTDGAGPGRP